VKIAPHLPVAKAFLIVVGFAVTALGLVVMLRSQLGMGPWGALEVGVASRSGLTLGQVAQLVSLILILVAWALKIPPSLVTLANMLLIGYFMDIFMKVVPAISGLVYQIPCYLTGLTVYCFGISFYLIASSGASGPRESTMLGVSRAFGITIKTARIGIDLFALLLAFATGGPIGVGTVFFAFSAGPVIQFFIHLRGFTTIKGKLVRVVKTGEAQL
jgi:hypothetical protein